MNEYYGWFNAFFPLGANVIVLISVVSCELRIWMQSQQTVSHCTHLKTKQSNKSAIICFLFLLIYICIFFSLLHLFFFSKKRKNERKTEKHKARERCLMPRNWYRHRCWCGCYSFYCFLHSHLVLIQQMPVRKMFCLWLLMIYVRR